MVTKITAPPPRIPGRRAGRGAPTAPAARPRPGAPAGRESDIRSVLAMESIQIVRLPPASLATASAMNPGPAPVVTASIRPLGADDAGASCAATPSMPSGFFRVKLRDRIVAHRPEGGVGGRLDPDKEAVEPVEGRQDAAHLHPMPAGGAGHHDLHANLRHTRPGRSAPLSPCRA